MFLRFVHLCWKFFAGIIIITIPLIIFNSFAPQITNTPGASAYYENDWNPLSVLTMQNLNPDSPWFYLYTAIAWVFSIYAYSLFHINDQN